MNLNIKYNEEAVLHAVSLHLQNIRESLTCAICKNLPLKPVRIITCSHSFCDICIQSETNCPTCKISFLCDNLLENPYAKRQIQCLFYIEDIIKNQNDKNKEKQNKSKESTKEKNPVNDYSNPVGNNPINLPNGFRNTLYPEIIWNNISNKNNHNTKKRNKVGETMLHKACISGKIDIVEDYIISIKNVNIPDNYNWTPLHEACKAGHLNIVKLLLEAGAIVNVPSMSYDTPLHFAVKHVHSEIVKELIECGAEIQAKTYEGVTPLNLANEKLRQIIEKTKPIKNIQPKIILPSNDIEIIFTPDIKTKIQSITNDKFSLKVTKIISEKTSFLIVPSHLCQVSLQTLSAILYGTWIVTINWYQECQKNKHIVNPTNYEVIGTIDFPKSNTPRRSRLCRQLLGPNLFHGCNFYIHGEKYEDKKNKLTFTKQDLIKLITLGSGTILKRCPRPETLSEKHYPFHACGKLQQCANYIIYLGEPLQPEYRFPEIHTLHVSWLLKCIQKYEISY